MVDASYGISCRNGVPTMLINSKKYDKCTFSITDQTIDQTIGTERVNKNLGAGNEAALSYSAASLSPPRQI